MTYKELVENFITTEKHFIAYRQGRYFVRIVKVPLAESVQALYANCTYCPEEAETAHRFEFSEKMEVVGFIDCHAALRFPTFDLTHNMVDDGNNIVEEKRNDVLAGAILAEVNKLALETSLPACPDEFYAYRYAYETLFLGTEAKAFPMHNNFAYYINDNTLIDYLADTPGWAKDIAQKWAVDFGGHRDGYDVTNLDMFRENLAQIKRIKEYMEIINADKKAPVHRYIAMKNAVKAKGAKTVIVEFKTASGEIASTKVNASAFCKANQLDIGNISLYDITPYHEGDRVARLLPKRKTSDGREYSANNLSKDDIVAIKYGRKVIWSSEDEV